MRVFHAAAATAIAVFLGSPVLAQGFNQPAEYPPAGYSGDQYVDSNGCMFVRAGYGGSETWVPRVNRSRQQICGQSPTSTNGSRIAATASTTAAPVAITVAAPSAPATPAARPATTIAVSTAPARPAPTAPVTVPVTPASRPIQTASAAPSNCQGLPAGAAQYMRGLNPRCGPQSWHPGDLVSGVGAAIPDGYRPAWDDGRLNPNRGLVHATPAGDAAMAAVWTSTVPRRAVDPTADGVSNIPVVTVATRTPDIAVEAPVVASTPEPTIAASYVEISRFNSRAEADAARAGLLTQGMPTALGGIERQSGMVFVLLSGPHREQNTLDANLSRAHALGYSGATIR